MRKLSRDPDRAVHDENERLLHLLVALQRETRHSRLLASARQAECEHLRASKERLERQLEELAAANADIAGRYVKVLRELASLKKGRVPTRETRC